MFTIFVIGRNQFFRQSFDKPNVLVGRALDNDVVLSDLTVSRRHCLIHGEQQYFHVEDLKSTNGCYLNGYILSGRTRSLCQAELRIGIFALYILVGQVDFGHDIGRPMTITSEPSDDPAAHARARHLVRTAMAPTERSSLHPSPEIGRSPTRASLRWLINQVLVSASDLDAFCLDHFPYIRSRFDGSPDRVSKVTLLLERAHAGEILRRIREDYPELTDHYEAQLCYEDC